MNNQQQAVIQQQQQKKEITIITNNNNNNNGGGGNLFKRNNMNPLINFVDMNDQMMNNYNQINMSQYTKKPSLNQKQDNNKNVINNNKDPIQNNTPLKRGISNNIQLNPEQISQNQQSALSKISENQQFPQYYGRIKKKSRILKIYKDKFIFIHNGYIGYVKARAGQDAKFQFKHHANNLNNKSDPFGYNVAWKDFKQDFSQSILVFVKIEDMKITEPEIRKSNQYFFEIYFPTSKLISDQKNIEQMNYQQLESEYVSEQQGNAQNNDNLKKDAPNTTTWYFQANTLTQLNEIKKSINDTKNPPNQQQNKEAEKKVRDLEKEQKEKFEQYQKSQEEGLKILEEERRKMEALEKSKKEQQDKEYAELEKKKLEQIKQIKQEEELLLRKKLENMQIGQKLKTAWNYQWMKGIEENIYQTNKMEKIFLKSEFMIKSQLAFIETSKNYFKEIIFNKSLKDDLKKITPLSTNQIRVFDPQLAQLNQIKDSFVKVYYIQNILFKVIFTTSLEHLQIIDYLIKSFKQEFKHYNQLNEDIMEILKYDDYFHLRAPQCCYLEYAGCIALCIALENIQIRQITKQDKVNTLELEEKIKLKTELNPIYLKQQKDSKQLLKTKPSSSFTANSQQQQDTQISTAKNEDPEEKKYEEQLKQMMKEEFNINLSDENSYKFIRLETEESTNLDDIERNKIEVSQILFNLSSHQRQNGKQILLGQDCQNFIMYLSDDEFHETFQKFNEITGQSNQFPKHTKTIFIQFKLILNPQITSSYINQQDNKLFENTFSFNKNALDSQQDQMKSQTQKQQNDQTPINDIKNQKSTNSIPSLSTNIVNALQIDPNLNQINSMEKQSLNRQFIENLQELKISPILPQDFRKEMKKYGIKCSELIQLIPIISQLFQGSQHAYVQIISRIVKKQFRSFMYMKIKEFQEELSNVVGITQQQQQIISQIESQLYTQIDELKLIKQEESNLLNQLKLKESDWQSADKSLTLQIEQIKIKIIEQQNKIEQIRNHLQSEKNQLKILIEGDIEEELEQNDNKNGFSQNIPSSQSSPERLFLKNKSSKLYSLTFSMNEVVGKNLTSIRSKFDMYLIESIRSFIKQIYFDYNQQQPEYSYWSSFIEPFFENQDKSYLQKEQIPGGVFFQEICKQIGILSKPTEKIKLFDYTNSQSVIQFHPYVKYKKYSIKNLVISQLDEQFDINLNQHLYMVTQSTIDNKYKILQLYYYIMEQYAIPLNTNDKQEENKEDGFNLNKSILQQQIKVTSLSKISHKCIYLQQIEQQIFLWEMKQLFEEHSYNKVIEYSSRIYDKYYHLQIEIYEVLLIVFQSYLNLGQINKAEEVFAQIKRVIEYNYGKNHLYLLFPIELLSKYYIRKKNYLQGLDYYRQTEEILTKIIGYNHPKTALCSSVIAELSLKIGNVDESIAYYERCLDQYIDYDQTQLRSIINTLLKLSGLYYDKCNYIKSYEKSQFGIELFYKYKLNIISDQDQLSFNVMFLQLIHISMKNMIEKYDFDRNKIRQYSQDFWITCLKIDVQNYQEIVQECLMLSLILNLIEQDYEERHYFVELLKQININEKEKDLDIDEINNNEYKIQENKFIIDLQLFLQEVKSNPQFDQFISTILKVYHREIRNIKPYFDPERYLKSYQIPGFQESYPQILNKVIYFVEVFRNVMGDANTDLMLTFDYHFKKFM